MTALALIILTMIKVWLLPEIPRILIPSLRIILTVNSDRFEEKALE